MSGVNLLLDPCLARLPRSGPGNGRLRYPCQTNAEKPGHILSVDGCRLAVGAGKEPLRLVLALRSLLATSDRCCCRFNSTASFHQGSRRCRAFSTDAAKHQTVTHRPDRLRRRFKDSAAGRTLEIASNRGRYGLLYTLHGFGAGDFRFAAPEALTCACAVSLL